MAAGADEPRALGDDPEGPVVPEERLVPAGAESGRDDEDPGRSLWRGLISLAILVALLASLLLAVPGLHGVADEVADMRIGWLVVAVVLEMHPDVIAIAQAAAGLQDFRGRSGVHHLHRFRQRGAGEKAGRLDLLILPFLIAD